MKKDSGKFCSTPTVFSKVSSTPTVYVKKNATNVPLRQLISVAYLAPRLFLCVCCTLTLSLKVLQSLDCSTFPVKTWCISPNRDVFGKKRHTLPAQPEANHKSVACNQS